MLHLAEINLMGDIMRLPFSPFVEIYKHTFRISLGYLGTKYMILKKIVDKSTIRIRDRRRFVKRIAIRARMRARDSPLALGKINRRAS